MNITSLWVGDKLPELAVLSMKSYLDHGHEFTLYTYRDYPNVPVGVSVKSASDILPKASIFRDNAHNGVAPFADWWRWKWLYECGGFWSDLDIVCLTSDMPDDPVQYYDQGDSWIAIGALRFPAGHIIPKTMMQLAEDPARPLPWDSEEEKQAKRDLFDKVPDIAARRRCVPWGYAGPTGLTKLIRYLGNRAVPPLSRYAIYPVHYSSWVLLYDGRAYIHAEGFANAWGVHMWGEMVRRNPEVWENRAKDSIAEYFVNKHLR